MKIAEAFRNGIGPMVAGYYGEMVGSFLLNIFSVSLHQ
jgi:hypothetical protein